MAYEAIRHGEPCTCGASIETFEVLDCSVGRATGDYELSAKVKCTDCGKEYNAGAFTGAMELKDD